MATETPQAASPTNPYARRGASSVFGSGSLDAFELSIYAVLATALPSALLSEALTAPGEFTREVASELAAGITPSWVYSLPYYIETWLEGSVANPTSSDSPQSSQQQSSQQQSSQQQSSQQHSSAQQSSNQPIEPTSSAPDSTAPSSSPQSTSLVDGFQTSSTRNGGTLTPLFPDANSTNVSPIPTNANDDAFPTGAVAGGVVGGVAGFALIGVGAVFLLRRRKKRQRIEPVREISVHSSIPSSGYRDF